MIRHSIVVKVLGIVIGAFLLTACSVLLLAHFQLKTIIDSSQHAFYDAKIHIILEIMERKMERLESTQSRARYEEVFQDMVLKELRQTYYSFPEQRIYPFIIDYKGEIVMHPELARGEKSIQKTPYVQKAIKLKNGNFNYTYETGETKWAIIRNFPEWNWVVGYTVPLEEKYADARLLRNSLAFILSVIVILVALTISAIIARMIRPIITLTETSKAMAAGNLEQEIDMRGKDEIGSLSRSFALMRDSIQEKIADLDEKNRELAKEITERKHAEEDLERYRMHLEELVKERTHELEGKTEELKGSEKELIALLEDTNEIKADLEKANEKLKELDKLKSMFIASMSHELRTPLNSIIGFTGIILQGLVGSINEEQKDQLQRVYNSAKHLLNLISDVIDISKVEGGMVEAYVEEFHLEKIIEEAVSSLKVQIDDKKLDLEIIESKGIKMKTDSRRLLQCILNILSNAIKFTEKGKIGVATSEKNDMIEIKVEDTGIGIAEKDITRLFGSFVRLDSHLKTATLGTGLGLYLTKKIATEILGGSISVESTYGEGSTFTLCIPKEI